MEAGAAVLSHWTGAEGLSGSGGAFASVTVWISVFVVALTRRAETHGILAGVSDGDRRRGGARLALEPGARVSTDRRTEAEQREEQAQVRLRETDVDHRADIPVLVPRAAERQAAGVVPGRSHFPIRAVGPVPRRVQPNVEVLRCSLRELRDVQVLQLRERRIGVRQVVRHGVRTARVLDRRACVLLSHLADGVGLSGSGAVEAGGPVRHRSCERGGVRPVLQVPAVVEEVREIDRKRHEQREHRQPDGDHDDDGAAFGFR